MKSFLLANIFLHIKYGSFSPTLLSWLTSQIDEIISTGEDRFYFWLGICSISSKNLFSAIVYLKCSLELTPDCLDARFVIALLFEELGLYQESILQYRNLLDLKQGEYFIHYQLGNLFQKQQSYQAAIEQYNIALKQNERFCQSWYNLGIVHQKLGNNGIASSCYSKSLEINPKYAKGENALGALHLLANNNHAAKACFERSISINSSYVTAFVNLALVEEKLGNFQQSENLCLKALSLDSQSPAILSLLIKIYSKTCQWSNVNFFMHQLWPVLDLTIKKGLQADIDVFNLFNQPLTPEQQYYLMNLKAQGIQNKIGKVDCQFKFNRQLNAKIRLGYVSSDFRDHPIGSQMERILKHHNKEEFEIYCYSISLDDVSEIRESIRNSSDCFRDLADVPYTEVADTIFSDKIDILIDLNGYTAYSKPEIFALRPAPIQINYLGNPGSTGSRSYHYFVTNKIATPPEQEAFITERCIFLPDCCLTVECVHEEIYKSDKILSSDSREEFVFCCFGRLEKIDTDVFSVWMKILLKVPNAVLWLLRFNLMAESNLRKVSAELGVDPKRIKFLDIGTKDYLLKKQSAADLFLDTLHFNANVTAANALSSGLPVLTMPGNTFISRVCASLLVSAGLPELIASDLKDYENIAISLANNPSKLLSLKESLIRKKNKLPLFDTASNVQHLEKAYVKVWRDYLSGKPAQNVEITK
jgi:protein O-GlcNAc transferase